MAKKEKKKQKNSFGQEQIKKKIKQVYLKSKDTINQHLWLELLFMVALALFVSGIVFLLVSHFVYRTDMGTREHVTYQESRNYVQKVLLEETARLNEVDNHYEAELQIDSEEYEIYSGEVTSQTESDSMSFDTEVQVEGVEETTENTQDEDKSTFVSEYIERILNQLYFDNEYVVDAQTYLVDGAGKLMYNRGIVESLDLIKVIQKANNSQYAGESNKFAAIYPVIINNEVCYLYNESTLQPFYHKEFTDVGNILALIAAAGVFILIIFRLTRDKIAYIEYLSTCLGEISTGNLNYEIEVIGEDELAQVAKSITHMENEIKYQMEAQIKTEKSKNELVTNVAHDLRTPLTSIIGYIGLVKGRGYHTKEEAEKYLDIAYNKAEKLKIIIEDLFELTKLHQHGIKLNKTVISLSNLLNQLVEELMPLANEKRIEIETYIDTAETMVCVDIGKMTRVFENLIENAIKYSAEGETIYVELKCMRNQFYIAVSNPAEGISQEEIKRFFERFYRADQSRNSSVGGSGLGLAIAKNIVELHGGKIKAELNQDLICFKVMLPREEV